MDIGKVVKNRIIELCEIKRWAYNALAVFAGVPPSTMKNIISGKSSNPGISTIKKLCDGLGITLGEFFNTKEFNELGQKKSKSNAVANQVGTMPSILCSNSDESFEDIGIVALKQICDGFGITLGEFFSTKEFDELEQEIK